MLELCKKVLLKVSFDAKLFQKELLKALTWLNQKEDIERLKIWCIENFGKKYPLVLAKVF
jgi:hypothetical protein